MRALCYPQPNEAKIVDVPTPTIEANQALAKTIVCNVSAGTELSFYKGTAPQLHFKPDKYGLWEPSRDAVRYPMQSNQPGCWWMGYASVAEIMEVGKDITDLKPDDVVFTHQSHKDYQVIGADYLKVSETLAPRHACFAMLAEIAFNGILDAHLHLMDNVVIFGMGTLGQLTVQMAKMSGANVIAVDFIENRLKLAQKLGADKIIQPEKDGDVARNVVEWLGDGADAVIEISGNSRALSDAVRCVRKEGQVTVVSFYQNPPANFEMGREFHHKRVRIRSSQIAGIDPSLTHQYTRPKRSATALKLLEKMQVEPLISHTCLFNDYPRVLKELAENTSEFQSIVIDYREKL